MILFNCINLHALATSWHWKWNLGGGGFVSSSLVVRLGTGCLDLSSGANVICKLTLEERLPGMRNRESTRSTFFTDKMHFRVIVQSCCLHLCSQNIGKSLISRDNLLWLFFSFPAPGRCNSRWLKLLRLWPHICQGRWAVKICNVTL